MKCSIKKVSIDKNNRINIRNYICGKETSIFLAINLINNGFSKEKMIELLQSSLCCGQSMDLHFNGNELKLIKYYIRLIDDNDNNIDVEFEELV